MVEKIINIFKKKYPGLKITKILDYDSDYWIVAAPKTKNEIDPFYGINKRNFEITNFSPAGNFEKFAMSKIIYG